MATSVHRALIRGNLRDRPLTHAECRDRPPCALSTCLYSEAMDYLASLLRRLAPNAMTATRHRITSVAA